MDTIRKWIHHWLLRYAFAVILVAVATWLYQQLREHVENLPLYLMHYPATITAAVVGGFGPGLVTVLLSVACIAYFFIPPVGPGQSHQAIA